MLPMSCTMTVYLGCYTDSAHPNGLKAFCFDEAVGRMEVVAEYPVPNALYQTLSPDGAILKFCGDRPRKSLYSQGFWNRAGTSPRH